MHFQFFYFLLSEWLRNEHCSQFIIIRLCCSLLFTLFSCFSARSHPRNTVTNFSARSFPKAALLPKLFQHRSSVLSPATQAVPCQPETLAQMHCNCTSGSLLRNSQGSHHSCLNLFQTAVPFTEAQDLLHVSVQSLAISFSSSCPKTVPSVCLFLQKVPKPKFVQSEKIF